jgi:hypothetical protein
MEGQMIVVAIAFYVGLFAVIFYAFFGPKDEQPGKGQSAPTAARPPNAPSKPSDGGKQVTIAGAVVGLVVVLGLAWAGGQYGDGNSLFPASSGGAASSYKSNYQSSYQPNQNNSNGDVWVDSYYRQDNTYVPGHYRTNADETPRNNYSTHPNLNPYTGKKGSRRP